jgi:hypothetical protein
MFSTFSNQGLITGIGNISCEEGPPRWRPAIINTGTVEVGNNGLGQLNVDEFLNQTSGILKIDIGGTIPILDYDVLRQVSTTNYTRANLEGTLQVNLINGFTPVVGNSFTIISYYESLSISFSTTNLPNITPNRWLISSTNNSMTLTVAAPYPVPPNDNCANAIDIPYTLCEGGQVTGTTQGATASGYTLCNSTTPAVDVWYKLQGVPSNLVFSDGGATNFAVYKGSCAALTPVYVCNSGTPQMTTTETYYLRVFSSEAAASAFTVGLNLPASVAVWTGTGGNNLWNNPNNWTPVGVPLTCGHSVIIGSGHTVNLNVNAEIGGLTLYGNITGVGNLKVGNINWYSGSMSGTGTTTTKYLDIRTSTTKTIARPLVTVSAFWWGGDINLNTGGSFTCDYIHMQHWEPDRAEVHTLRNGGGTLFIGRMTKACGTRVNIELGFTIAQPSTIRGNMIFNKPMVWLSPLELKMDDGDYTTVELSSQSFSLNGLKGAGGIYVSDGGTLTATGDDAYRTFTGSLSAINNGILNINSPLSRSTTATFGMSVRGATANFNITDPLYLTTLSLVDDYRLNSSIVQGAGNLNISNSLLLAGSKVKLPITTSVNSKTYIESLHGENLISAPVTINGTLRSEGLNDTLTVGSTGLLTLNHNTLEFSSPSNSLRFLNKGKIVLEKTMSFPSNAFFKNFANSIFEFNDNTSSEIILTMDRPFQNEGTLKTGKSDKIIFNNGLVTTATSTISGTGTLQAPSAFVLQGTVAPGASPGTLTMNPSVSSTTSSIYEMEIIGGYGAAGTADDADKLESSGNIALNGTLKIILNNPAVGSYPIFNSTGGTVSGFSNLTVLYSKNGGAFSTTTPQNVSIQINSNNIIVNVTGALPVELLSFSAKEQDKNAHLTWQTDNETLLKNFDIEKSLDGKTFDKIGETKANNAPSFYAVFDNNFTASSYYRLKINELDGHSNFSKIVYLEKNGDKSIKIARYTEGSFFVETDDKIEGITVTNSIGQVVKTTKEKQLSIADLNAGIYIVSVKTDKGFVSQKFFKE